MAGVRDQKDCKPGKVLPLHRNRSRLRFPMAAPDDPRTPSAHPDIECTQALTLRLSLFAAVDILLAASKLRLYDVAMAFLRSHSRFHRVLAFIWFTLNHGPHVGTWKYTQWRERE